MGEIATTYRTAFPARIEHFACVMYFDGLKYYAAGWRKRFVNVYSLIWVMLLPKQINFLILSNNIVP